MTAISKHNLDMAWETSPAHESLKLKKARLTPRPFTITPRPPWSPTLPQKTPAAEEPVQRKIRTSPAVLRALRESELVARNKAVPHTPVPTKTLAVIPVREARKEIVANEKAELRLFYIIAAIAAVAPVEGVWGLSNFLDHWSAFADFVYRIFAAN